MPTAEEVLRAHPWIASAHREPDGVVRIMPHADLLATRPTLGDLVGDLVQEFLDQWAEVYDHTYTVQGARHGPDLDLSGWRATDTGEPFPVEHMTDWLARTVDLVLHTRPRRVFEIGSGTGMLAHRLHPHVDGYVGCDPSEVAVSRLRAAGLPRTTVVCAAAHQIASRPVREALRTLGGPPDCVLLNSVIGCFPDVTYLRAVLLDAITLVAPGGTVVVGDVRNAGLLGAYCRWAEEAAAPTASGPALARRAAQRAEREEELLVDPATLAAAAAVTSRDVRIAVHARTMRADTELSRYRFDAVLHIEHPAPDLDIPSISWDTLDGDRLAALGVLVRRGPVRLSGVPNRLLRDDPRGVSPYELRAAVSEHDAAVLLDPRDPATLQVAVPWAAAAVPVTTLQGPGQTHEPLSGFARHRVAETARHVLRQAAPTAPVPRLRIDLPAADPPSPTGPELTAAADRAGRAAIADVDPAELPAVMRRLDAVALLAMALTLRERGEMDGSGPPRSADEITDAMAVADRHRWIVRRWLGVLTAEGWLVRDAGRCYHHLRPVSREQLGSAGAALDQARRGLGYPPELTRFFRTAIDHLPELLRDEIPLQALLFPDGEITTALGTYQDNTINRYLNAAVAELLRRTATRRPGPLRVVEFGAGVGGSTAAALAALDGHPVDYLFTDVSPFFLDAARDRFGDHPAVQYALADINSELRGQGLTTGAADVVLAANVLHNAHHIGDLLHRLRPLLAPGGLLAIVESCREHYQAMTSMQFLMSPRPGHPHPGRTDVRAGTDRIFLSRDEWRAELTAAALAPVLDLPRPGHPLSALAQHLFVATPLPQDRSYP